MLLNSPAIRHTGDVRASMALPGQFPNFAQGAVQISEYLKGVYTVNGTRVVGQLQWNAVNRRWARKGTVPFYGDYIDIATMPYLAPDRSVGRRTWTPNNQTTQNTPLGPVPFAPNLLVAWSDNRDMRAAPGVDNNPAVAVPYTTPAGLNLPAMSVYDPTQTRPVCTVPSEAYKTGTTNQNTYTARLSVGFVAAAPGNNKSLGALQRAFVVFVRNDTGLIKTFQLAASPPAGGRASFDQFDPLRLVAGGQRPGTVERGPHGVRQSTIRRTRHRSRRMPRFASMSSRSWRARRSWPRAYCSTAIPVRPKSTARRSIAGRSSRPKSTARKSTAEGSNHPRSTARRSIRRRSTAPRSTARRGGHSASVRPKSTARRSIVRRSTAPRSIVPRSTAPRSTAPRSPTRGFGSGTPVTRRGSTTPRRS